MIVRKTHSTKKNISSTAQEAFTIPIGLDDYIPFGIGAMNISTGTAYAFHWTIDSATSASVWLRSTAGAQSNVEVSISVLYVKDLSM